MYFVPIQFERQARPLAVSKIPQSRNLQGTLGHLKMKNLYFRWTFEIVSSLDLLLQLQRKTFSFVRNIIV